MSAYDPDPLRLNNAHRHLLGHMLTMPGWHKLVLLLGGLFAFAGGIGRIAGATRAEAPAVQHQPSGGAPASSPHFVSDSPITPAVQASREDDGGLLIRLSPHAMRVGLSVVSGFFIGWLFRAFVKTMALLAMLGTGVLMALSYFGVLNVDLSAAREHYASAFHWLGDQTMRLKDVVVAHLPSSGGGTLGAWLGFRRR